MSVIQRGPRKRSWRFGVLYRLSPTAYTKCIAVRNTFIIFLLSGFWHGANWTFIAWGAYHALLFVPLLLTNKNRRYRDTVATITLPDGTTKSEWFPSLKEIGQMLLTFALAVIGWIIFRAETLTDAWQYMCGMCQWGTLKAIYRFFILPEMRPMNWVVIIMLLVEWINRRKELPFIISWIKRPWLRIVFYYGLVCLMIFFSGQNNTFIYFQF